MSLSRDPRCQEVGVQLLEIAGELPEVGGELLEDDDELHVGDNELLDAPVLEAAVRHVPPAG